MENSEEQVHLCDSFLLTGNSQIEQYKNIANSWRIFKTVFDWTEQSEDDSRTIFKAQSLFIRVSFSEFNFH